MKLLRKNRSKKFQLEFSYLLRFSVCLKKTWNRWTSMLASSALTVSDLASHRTSLVLHPSSRIFFLDD